MNDSELHDMAGDDLGLVLALQHASVEADMTAVELLLESSHRDWPRLLAAHISFTTKLLLEAFSHDTDRLHAYLRACAEVLEG